MSKEKVVLAYSGGLDTTAIIPWLKETFNYDVICCCIDCGQGEELDGLDERAKYSGASKLYILDVVDELCDEYIMPTVQADAVYENKYLLGTAMARPGIAKKLVEIASQLNLPEGTVRSWKNRYKWDCNVAKEKRNVAKADAKTVESVMENTKLTAEQQLFCILYAKTLNATQSYMKAYGCSYESAMTNSFRLLRNDRVKAEIQRLKKERFESRLFDEHDVFQWYLDIATASITDFVTFGRKEIQAMGAFGPITDKKTGSPVMREVNYVDFRESSQVDGRVIKKVKMGKDGASIELYDAMKAMEWLADHMAMGTGNQQKLAETIIGAYERRQKEMKGDEENASTEQ